MEIKSVLPGTYLGNMIQCLLLGLTLFPELRALPKDSPVPFLSLVLTVIFCILLLRAARKRRRYTYFRRAFTGYYAYGLLWGTGFSLLIWVAKGAPLMHFAGVVFIGVTCGNVCALIATARLTRKLHEEHEAYDTRLRKLADSGLVARLREWKKGFIIKL